jgi:hypothetical protein
MKKTSIASLQERLGDWTSWDMTIYQVGACLGFWPEFGAPGDATGPFGPWHGVKGVIWSDSVLGDAIADLIYDLVQEGCLERREEPDTEYRWNPKYKGHADLISTLE